VIWLTSGLNDTPGKAARALEKRQQRPLWLQNPTVTSRPKEYQSPTLQGPFKFLHPPKSGGGAVAL
jgi:hypothetical protein